MVLLFARLAHHILLWSKRWLSRVPTTRGRLDGYGLVRLLQEESDGAWRHPVAVRLDGQYPF